ncbi:MAG: hypothetical protein KIT84_28685 [Labilithrix sp.]|nr:hypothetical protein [Labilithrix sp.]MCW5815037.1 hypothetical protein [Labilithrix sp.]
MRRLLAPLLLLAAACVSTNDDEAGSSEGAATAEARASLDAFTGRWRVESDASEVKAFPAEVLIVVTDQAVDPVTKTTKGTRLRIMRVDAPNVPAVDRAPFLDVDEGKDCENTSLGGGESVTWCHETTLTNGGKKLSHTISGRSWTGYIFPSGWSKATQVLALEDGKLHYTYEIDGEPAGDVTLVR